MNPKWLTWAQKMQSIAQAGIEYSQDDYDIERFEQLSEIAVEILHEYTELDSEKIQDLFANEEGYRTPKIDVRAIVPNRDRILLVQEKLDGKWALPGGWAEIDLSLKENVEKEVFEEAGITTDAREVVAILDRSKQISDPYPYSVYKIFVLCKGIDGEFRANVETTTASFFKESEIPELSETRNTIEQIEMCFIYLQSDNRLAVFD